MRTPNLKLPSSNHTDHHEEIRMTTDIHLGGTYTFRNTSLTVHRMGYGAMQLAGPQVWGPPRDPDGAIAVLREAIASGVNHIDTSDFYGPHVTNQIIKQALHPYPEDLVIVTKVGAKRGPDKSWNHALSRQELIDAVHDNLRNLALDRLDVVNLRIGGVMGPLEGSIAEPLSVLAELKQTRTHPTPRRQQHHSTTARRGPNNYRHRMRAELLQRRPSRRRPLYRRPLHSGNRIRAILPVRRLYSTAVL
jgi:hypothetical protein